MDTIETLIKARELEACKAAIQWLESLPPDADPWAECERGDWMLWFAAMLEYDRKLIVTAACCCARLASPFVPDGDARPRIALETAEAWTRGEATIWEVGRAYPAADGAYPTAANAAYAAPANAASAAPANAAAKAASAAPANAAYANAANAADYASSRRKILTQCANIVREIIPKIDR